LKKCLTPDLAINETVNIGSDHEISILELAKLLIGLTKSKSQIKFAPPLLEGDMTRRLPDIAKMKSILQRELTPLNTGIQHMLI